jgi:predicted RNA-binding Zn ribbon-like protein
LLFAPDTEESLEFAVELTNTTPTASRSGADELSTPAELVAFLRRERFSGRVDGDVTELAEVIETRQSLRRLWMLDRDDIAEEINSMLRRAHALTQLVRHDGLDWHPHATPPDAPLAERIRVEAALALADVIRTNSTDRLRVCAADDCDGLLVDLSRNGSKRFCSVRCGNRMSMVAYRERQATIDSESA